MPKRLIRASNPVFARQSEMDNLGAIVTANPSESMSRAWRNHLLALGALLILILADFHHAVSAALTVWMVSPTYSHCFLILPIVGWLIWEKRDVLRTMQPGVEPRALLLILPLLVLWWLGQLSAVNEVTQYAIVGLIQVAIVALLGPKVVRQIWFPVFFLLFLVPTGEYLTAPMQRFATRFVDVGLNIFGIPHYTEGTVFELTNGRFEIAEACAGLRFLIATVTLSFLFAYLSYRRIYKIVLFLLASVVIPLLGNGLRCLGIILLAHFTSNAYGTGADHIIYGWGFNVAILFGVLLVGSMFRDVPKNSLPARMVTRSHPNTAISVVLVALVAAILVSAGPAWALWRDRGSVKLDKGVIRTALRSGGWHEEVADDNWRPYFPGADIHVQAERDDGEPVNLFLGYYARPQGGHTVTAGPNRAWNDKVWIATGGSEVRAWLGASPIALNELTISSESGRRLVWFTYWVGGTVTDNQLLVRFLEARAALSGHGGQAIIAISTPLDDSIEVVRGRLRTSLSPLAPVVRALHGVEPASVKKAS
jgi:exosortase A